MFNEILKISFNLLKKNTNLSQHLFLFFIILMLLVPNISGIKSIFFLAVFFVFVCAFMAGWLNAFKTAYNAELPKVDCYVNSDNDTVEISNRRKDLDDETLVFPPMYFKEFFEGVGDYFPKFLLGGLIYVFILGLIFYMLNIFIEHYVVIPQALHSVNLKAISLMSQEELNNFVISLSQGDQLKILKIASLITGAFVIINYFLILFPVVLIKSEKNAFYCLFESIKVLFRNIPVSFLIFILFSGLLFLLSFGFTTPQNLIIFFISFILYCYLCVFYYMTLFVYYEKTK